MMTTTIPVLSELMPELKLGKRFYAPELDALRLFAFFLIFIRHVMMMYGESRSRLTPVHSLVSATPVMGASEPQKLNLLHDAIHSLSSGVCLFFFLSAYLITKLLLIEMEKTGKIAVRDFYVRRSLRIWPLYFTFIAGLTGLSYFLPVLHNDWQRLLASCFFVANIMVPIYGWGSAALSPLWSISVEEQFYLLWPTFAKFGRRGILTASALMGAISLLMLFNLGGAKAYKVWPNSLVQFLFFAGGGLAALYIERHPRSGLQRSVFFLSGFACWVLAKPIFGVGVDGAGSAGLVFGYLALLAGTALIFCSVLGVGVTIPQSILHLGKISYGLYVFHALCLDVSLLAFSKLRAPLPVIHGLNALSGLGLTIALALLSYRYIESPFLKYKERFTAVRSRPV